LYLLFNAADGTPIAMFDGAALTTLRTPAGSALATDALARYNVKTIGVLGTGPQALAHPGAVRTVRPSLESVVVAGRRPGAVEEVVRQLRTEGFDARPGSWDEAAGCDVVCGCTRADQPLFGAAALRPGSHLNLVGSYRLDLREVGAEVVAASTVIVDELMAAKTEAGDLHLAAVEGLWAWDRVAGDLADVACGLVTRQSDSQITMFKSVGLAVQDLAVAERAAQLLELV
jgi:ornithine cyclodeaminase/alanine dehydrogenase-like protein (mu-crystallin family)